MKIQSKILKLALFATGLSGIVAEYILASLATYFIGDSVFQWSMIVSVMMFSMGLGSRISQYIKTDLLKRFIYIEFLLSVLVAFSSLIAYTMSAYSNNEGIIIYSMGILIGLLIGMEIPLVVRLNDEFEALHVNVSSVIAMDYFGSLLGGFLYVFFGIPILGLTYTPFFLGSINFLVALVLLLILWKHIIPKTQRKLTVLFIAIALLIGAGIYLAQPIVKFGEQKQYNDKVIFSAESRYQKIVITQWKDNYWLYINGNQQLSSLDEAMYHEPLVHPAMKLAAEKQDILVMGGGDGCAIREILKYQQVKTITLVDLDPMMTDLGKEHPILQQLNEGSMNDPKVNIVNTDGFIFLEKTKQFFDVIIIDLPDPKSIDLGRLYSKEFYKLCKQQLRPRGILVTQAGSPYFATKAYNCINRSMQEAGFNTLLMHNQVITLGEWGWVIGAKHIDQDQLKPVSRQLRFNDINTKWLNNEAMLLMTSFGKEYFPHSSDSVEVNTIHNPVLYRYYLKGNWDVY